MKFQQPYVLGVEISVASRTYIDEVRSRKDRAPGSPLKDRWRISNAGSITVCRGKTVAVSQIPSFLLALEYFRTLLSERVNEYESNNRISQVEGIVSYALYLTPGRRERAIASSVA